MNMFDFAEEFEEKKEFNIECKYCYKVYAIYLYEEDFDAWNNGEGYIQELMNYLTAGERELLISNTCNDCWKKMHPSA